MIKTTFHPQKRHFTGSYFSVYQENVPSQHFFGKKTPIASPQKIPSEGLQGILDLQRGGSEKSPGDLGI